VSIRLIAGKWLIVAGKLAAAAACCCSPPCSGPCDEETPCPEGCNCCDGVCQEEECVLGACCDDDGTCSQTTEGDCSGAWHEGVDCDDIDCTSGCCENVSSPNGGCFYSRCGRGETDDCGSPCDPDEPQPVEPVPDCEDGQPTDVTVTGAGYVMNTGDAAFDAAVEAVINNSYVVTLGCNGSASERFETADAFIDVTVGVSTTRGAGISVLWKPFNFQAAAIQLGVAADVPTATDCGADIYPCGNYSGTVTSFGGLGDGSAATIDVQGV
jgi:hypothetical protein